MHDLYAVGLPLIVFLAGNLWNGQQTRDLRAEISAMRSDIHADLRALNQIAFPHETRIITLEGKGKSI